MTSDHPTNYTTLTDVTAHLMPNLSNAIDAEVFLKYPLNLGLQILVTLGAVRKT